MSSKSIRAMIACVGLVVSLSGCAAEAAPSPPPPAYAAVYPYSYPSDDPLYYGDPYGVGLDHGWYGAFGHRRFEYHFDRRVAHAGVGGHFGGHFGGGHGGGGHR